MQLIHTETRLVDAETQELRKILEEIIPDVNQYEVKAANSRVVGYDVPITVKTSNELAKHIAGKTSVLTTCSLVGTWIRSHLLKSNIIIELTAFSLSTSIKARLK